MKQIRIIFCFFILFLFSLKGTAQENRGVNPSTQHLAPEVDFSWLNDCPGDTTLFVNESIRGNFYQWYIFDIENGDTLFRSNDTNMKFVFPAPGQYLVYLKVNNGHVVSTTETVSIDTLMTPDFNFMHCSNQFVNHSICASSFKWDFGDGATSTLIRPVHQYADTGHYTVKLVAS